MTEGSCEAARRAFDQITASSEALSILVIGDVMLDQFIYGNVERISPEAPVPVVEVEREVFCLGGAANVVRNLHHLGARVALVGVVGGDENAEEIRTQLGEMGVGSEGLIELADRPTAIKTRVIAQHQQVVRFDRELRAALPTGVHERMLDQLRGALPDAGAVIVSDYGKGIVTARFMESLVAAASAHGVLVAVDPKPVNAPFYRGVGVMTPNVKETESMMGLPARSDAEAESAGTELLRRHGCEAVLVTRGESGMTLVERDGGTCHIPTVARDVFDVTGAGDTTISVLALARAAGCSYLDAACLANVAAGIAVGKLGTTAVTAEELGHAVGDRA